MDENTLSNNEEIDNVSNNNNETRGRKKEVKEVIKKPRQTRAPLVKEGDVIEIPFAQAKKFLKENKEKPKRTEAQEQAFLRMREALEKKRAELAKLKQVDNVLEQKEQKQEPVKIVVRQKEKQSKKGTVEPQKPSEIKVDTESFNHYNTPPPPPSGYNGYNPYMYNSMMPSMPFMPHPYMFFPQYPNGEVKSKEKKEKKASERKKQARRGLETKSSFYSDSESEFVSSPRRASDTSRGNETDYDTRIKRLNEINEKLRQTHKDEQINKFSVF